MLFIYHTTSPTAIYTLSLHDALPIWPGDFTGAGKRRGRAVCADRLPGRPLAGALGDRRDEARRNRSEEHTSELQSRGHLVCRLLLEKKQKSVNMVRKIQLCH